MVTLVDPSRRWNIDDFSERAPPFSTPLAALHSLIRREISIHSHHSFEERESLERIENSIGVL